MAYYERELPYVNMCAFGGYFFRSMVTINFCSRKLVPAANSDYKPFFQTIGIPCVHMRYNYAKVVSIWNIFPPFHLESSPPKDALMFAGALGIQGIGPLNLNSNNSELLLIFFIVCLGDP